MRLLPFLVCLFLFPCVTAQTPPVAYQLYGPTGKRISYKKMVRSLSEADVILFGELHNNPVAHWMQRELAAALPAFDLGLEMFETDEQFALEGYRRGRVTVGQLDTLTGGLWPNFRTDYQPLVDFAGAAGAGVYATNVPRSVARRVFREGFATLRPDTVHGTAILPPLPIPYDPDLPAYRRMLEMMPGGHGGDNFPKAQAIKDATMAHRILTTRRPGTPYLHLNGSYHSDDHEGIAWYLRQYDPGVRVLTISTIEGTPNEFPPEARGKADYILLVNPRVTKSY